MGLAHFTLLPVLLVGVLVPIVGKWLIDDAWPERPHLSGAASVGLVFLGCMLTWGAGRWLASRLNGSDPRFALISAAFFGNMPFLKTGAPLPLQIINFVFLSLPIVSLWFGLGLTRWSWGPFRFVAVWLIDLGLMAGLFVVFLLTQEAHASRMAQGAWALGYTVAAAIVAVLAGRILRRRWRRQRPLHPATVLAPTLLLSLLPLLDDGPLAMRAILAGLLAFPIICFAAAFIGFRRGPVDA